MEQRCDMCSTALHFSHADELLGPCHMTWHCWPTSGHMAWPLVRDVKDSACLCVQGQRCDMCSTPLHFSCASKLFANKPTPRCPRNNCSAPWPVIRPSQSTGKSALITAHSGLVAELCFSFSSFVCVLVLKFVNYLQMWRANTLCHICLSVCLSLCLSVCLSVCLCLSLYTQTCTVFHVSY